jgi:hypothetical protein
MDAVRQADGGLGHRACRTGISKLGWDLLEFTVYSLHQDGGWVGLDWR